jgi:hypothetical protein
MAAVVTTARRQVAVLAEAVTPEAHRTAARRAAAETLRPGAVADKWIPHLFTGTPFHPSPPHRQEAPFGPPVLPSYSRERMRTRFSYVGFVKDA